MSSMLRRLAPILLLCGSLFSSGCLPSAGWLPDSSGFFFTENKGKRLCFYDCVKKTRSTLVEDTGGETFLPGVSPDGTEIALARITRAKGKQDRLQVLLYDRKGKLNKTSKEFEIPGAPRDEKNLEQRAPVMVWWQPGHKILVGDLSDRAPAPGAEKGPTSIVYDPRKNDFTALSTFPCIILPQPLLPDGKGFLGFLPKKDSKESAIGYFGYDGKLIQELDPKKQPEEKKGEAIEFRWEKNNLVVVTEENRLVVDVVKGTFNEQKVKVKLLPAAGKLKMMHTFPDGKTRVVVYEEEMKAAAQGARKTISRIEYQDLATKKQTVIKGNIPGSINLGWNIAPNQKSVALLCPGNDPQKKAELVVVHADGTHSAVEVKMED